jgi:hypothetical protein
MTLADVVSVTPTQFQAQDREGLPFPTIYQPLRRLSFLLAKPPRLC